jgi:hypothetical protein
MRKIFLWSRFLTLAAMVFILVSLVSIYFYEFDYDKNSFLLNQNVQLTEGGVLSIDSLKKTVGKNKIIPQAIENECLMALACYPELANAHIIFDYAPIKYTMQTQPHISTFIRRRVDRTYLITVNNDAKRYTGLDYNELSPTAKIGWVGHELGHICDYEQMNVPEIVGFAVCYGMSSAFRKIVEHRVDKITIQHGLGTELYEGADYLLNKSNANEAYKNTQRKEYMPLEVIKAEIIKSQN